MTHLILRRLFSRKTLFFSLYRVGDWSLIEEETTNLRELRVVISKGVTFPVGASINSRHSFKKGLGLYPLNP